MQWRKVLYLAPNYGCREVQGQGAASHKGPWSLARMHIPESAELSYNKSIQWTASVIMALICSWPLELITFLFFLFFSYLGSHALPLPSRPCCCYCCFSFLLYHSSSILISFCFPFPCPFLFSILSYIRSLPHLLSYFWNKISVVCYRLEVSVLLLQPLRVVGSQVCDTTYPAGLTTF